MLRRLRPRPRLAVDAAALLGLALLALIFFWPVSLGRGWIPRGGGDLVSFLWPTYSYAAQALRSGRLPLWNETLYSGAPFAADNQSGLFYPLNLITFFLWPGLPYQAMEWLVVLHVWLAGAGMYLLLRGLLAGWAATPGLTLRRAPPARAVFAALFAAVAYMFSDVFVTHVGNLNIIAVAAWLPLALLALHLGLGRGSAGWSAVAGVLLAAAALAGHAQMTLMLVLALGLLAAWYVAGDLVRLVRRPAPAGASRELGPSPSAISLPRRLLLAALPFVIAFGLSAVALIPALEMTQHTGRARLDYAGAAEYSLPWAGLAGLVSPLLFGRGAAEFWGPWPRVELGYVGALTLPLALLAPFRARRGLALFLAGLGLFGLLVALGSHTPFHRLLYEAVPGFAQLRVPARFILLTDFALAALAGLGLYCAPEQPRRRLLAVGLGAWIAGLAVAATAFASVPGAAGYQGHLWRALSIFTLVLLAGWSLLAWRPAPAGLLLVGVLALDLVGQGAWVEVDPSDPTRGYQHPAVVAFLKSQPGPTRMASAAGAWAPDAAARFGLEDIGGIFNPLGLAAYQTYTGAMGDRGSPLYNFLNVQFVVTDKGQAPGPAGSPFVPVFDEDPELDVYLNTAAMPRVSLIYTATVVDSGEAAFGAIHAPGFDPAAQVVIDSSLAGGRAPDLPAPPSPAAGPSNLYYLDYAPEAYSVVAVTPGPAWLVFSEVWYPGWRAWIGEAEVPIYRANFAFRAVFLPRAGEHVVTLRYVPDSWRVGLGLTLLTLLGLLAWAATAGYRQRRG